MIFGGPVIRPTELATIIATKVIPLARRIELRNLKKIGTDQNRARRRAIRTRAIKVLLRREGRKLGLHTFPNSDKRLAKPQSQWLYDIVWWDDRQGRKGVELAVESEWNANKNDILDDFEKLLTIKSPLKLMIYRVRRNTKDQVREEIKKYFLDFRQHVRGENYILCEFQPNWTCNCYLYRVKREKYGKVTDVRYRTLYEC